MGLDSKDITFLRNMGGVLLKLAEMDNMERDITALEAKRQQAVQAKDEADAATAQAQADHATMLADLKADAEANRNQVLLTHANTVDATQKEWQVVTDQLEAARTTQAEELAKHTQAVAALRAEHDELKAAVDELKTYAAKSREVVGKL